ncbi:DNA internalization-related competence protein ComEC/Rec2 [Lapidilactobacillus dextrinicus]|uniref:DNA internalization-related competence protein ComEC/Rec2 n=1 Tax=Lapidilactobacillus dextrinicus TaxID=51664 RepID=UPI003F28EA1F
MNFVSKSTIGYDRSYSGKLLLVGLGTLTLSGILWQPSFWLVGTSVLLFLGWRLFCARSHQLTIITIFILLLFTGRQLQWQNQYQLLTNCEAVVLKADGYKINGDLLTGIGQSGSQKIFLTAKISSEQQHDFLLKNDSQCQLLLKNIDLTMIESATNWHEFDFKDWAAHRQVYQQVNAEIVKVKQIPVQSVGMLVSHLRKKFLNSLTVLPKYGAFHLRALVAGYSERDDLEIRELLSTAGIIHLFALSGLHIDLLIRSCRWLGSRIFIPDEVTRLLLVIFLPLYAIFVGQQIGILRAILTYFLHELLQVLEVRMASLDQLTIVMLCCLWLQPLSFLELGPQLSFILSFVLRLVPKKLTSWQLQLRLGYLSMLLILFRTATFNLIALLMGGLFAPLFGLLIMPTTLVTLVFPQACYFFESIWVILYGLLAKLFQQSYLQVTIGQVPLLMIGSLLIYALIVFELRKIKHQQITILVLPLLIVGGYYRLGFKDQVTVIDVGQGDSILVQTAFPKRTLLIDTGGQLVFTRDPWQVRSTKSRVEKITIPYLRSQGISKLDYVLLTHQDADHLGDLAILLKKFPVKNIVFTRGMTQNPNFITQLQPASAKTHFLPKLAGERLQDQRLNGWFVAPQQPGIGENKDSLTLFLKLGNVKWLFTGDLDRAGELAITKKYPTLTVDYLKAGHHGSKTSNDPGFISQISPRLVVISSGRNNRYHHPSQETLTTLKQLQVPYLNTAQYGMIEWYFKPLTKQSQLRTKLVGNEQNSGQ